MRKQDAIVCTKFPHDDLDFIGASMPFYGLVKTSSVMCGLYEMNPQYIEDTARG